MEFEGEFSNDNIWKGKANSIISKGNLEFYDDNFQINWYNGKDKDFYFDTIIFEGEISEGKKLNGKERIFNTNKKLI